jgi:ABC-type transport system substrate-binding protein
VLRKLVSGLLLVFFMLVLAACGGPAPAAAPATEQAASNAGAALTPQPGGEIVVAYKDDLATLDPAIGYDWTNWPAIKMVFDGLLGYDSGTTLQPSIAAEMPTVSDDGLTYTFKIRPGVKFSNGREVTADDVVYTITRVLDPATASPGAGFYVGIKGAQEFIDGSATSVEGVKAVDPQTVEFTLATPDATFMNKMALNFAFIVAKEAVDAAGQDFGRQPVGTGPFTLTEWKSGEYLVFERNPNYFREGMPYLDKITIRVGIEPSVAVLQLEKGDIQLMGDPPPGAEWARIKADPAWSNRIEVQPKVNTTYIAINTTTPPFDNVKVRQALNHAIDKQRIVQLLNGRADVANQILPALMPGYDPDYKGYEFDPEKAKALLAEAGFADGFETTIQCIAVDPQPKLCESFQQDLANIGVKLNIETLAAPSVIENAGNGANPLTWSGGLAWTQDYPDPDDFYAPILGCDSNVPGGWNWSRYCNEELHAKSKELLAMTDQAARMEAYKAFFKTMMDDAVWVPVIADQYNVAHSEKLHGQPLLTHPEYSLVYENMWLEK